MTFEQGQTVSFRTNTGKVLTGKWLGTNSRRRRRNRVEVTETEKGVITRVKVWNVSTQNILDHTDIPEEEKV